MTEFHYVLVWREAPASLACLDRSSEVLLRHGVAQLSHTLAWLSSVLAVLWFDLFPSVAFSLLVTSIGWILPLSPSPLPLFGVKYCSPSLSFLWSVLLWSAPCPPGRVKSPNTPVTFCVPDLSEIESYRSYSPQDDRRAVPSDLSSHSSNERLREKPR